MKFNSTSYNKLKSSQRVFKVKKNSFKTMNVLNTL